MLYSSQGTEVKKARLRQTIDWMIIFATVWLFKNNYKIICQIKSICKEAQLSYSFLSFILLFLAVGASCASCLSFPTLS